MLNCELEPIRFSGAIQSHGALIVLGKDGRTIEAASTTCQNLLGLLPERLFDQRAEDIFGTEHAARLAQCADDVLKPLIPWSIGSSLWARSNRNAQGQFLIDIEPASGARPSEFLYRCRQCSSLLRRLSDFNQIVARAADMLQELTGFDRVMMYRFDSTWNGEVIAETRIEAVEPFLGRTFPAYDLPKQVRDLLQSNRIRHIPDITYVTAHLIARDSTKPIDLAPSSLRGASPRLLGHLCNMKVRAILVGALVIDGELWGLVSCHHTTDPKYFGPDERDALRWFCEDLAALIEFQLLREREAIDQTILNSIPEHIAVLDRTGVITAVNESWTQFAKENGVAPDKAERFVGTNYKNYCIPVASQQDGDAVLDTWNGIEAVLKLASASFTCEYPCDSPQETRWFRMIVFPLHGAAEGAVVAHEDITSRKLAEIALRESETRFRELFENNSSAMGLVEPITGKIVEVNLAAARFYGYTKESMVGMSLAQFNVLPVEQINQLRAQALTGQRKSFELQHRLASGQVREVEVHSTPIISSGRTLMFSIIHDVSDRKQAEMVRTHALERLKKIVHRVPGVVYQFRLYADGGSCFPFASEAITDIYRVTPQEVQRDGSLVFESLHPQDYDRVSASIKHSAATLTRWDCEYRVRFADGEVRWLHGSASPERESDGSTLWHGYIEDISKRKSTEAELTLYREHLEELVVQKTEQLEHGVAALREREELFRLLAQNTSDGLAVLENYIIIYASPTYLQILGYEEQEELGRDPASIHALIHPDDVDRVTSIVYAAIGVCCANTVYTYRAKHKNGHYVWREDSTRLTYHSDGTLYRCYVVARDVTESVATKARLERTTELLTQTGHVAKIGGWELDLTTKMVDWSEQVFRIIERAITGPQTLEQAISCFVPDSQSRIRAALAQALDQGLDWNLELEAMTDEGESRWIEHLGQVVRDGRQMVRIFGSMRDITFEVLQRRVGQEHQQLLQLCFDNLQTGVAVFSETAMLYCNHAFRSVLGYADKSPLAQLTIESLVQAVDQDERLAYPAQTTVNRANLPAKLMTLSGNNGITIKCLLSGSIVPWNGESQFLVSITPISDADKIEMEMRATEDRYERLLVTQLENQQAAIARELHDSLGSRLAGVAMLLGGISQRHPALEGQIKMARDHVQTAAEVSRALARGLMPVDASTGSFWRALERLCLDYQQMSGVSCIFSVDGDFESVEAETGNHLFRIAQEALVNAVKHGHASVIRVILEERVDSYAMEVADNGRQTPAFALGTHSSIGIGLKSMQFRAKSIGAVLRRYINGDGGVTVSIEWPVPG